MSDREREEYLLDRAALADRLGIQPSTVDAWRREGRIPALRLGHKTVRYSWRAVLAALRSESEKGQPSRPRLVGGGK